MNVPFVALDRRNAVVGEEYDAAFRRVLERGMFVLGPELEAFEAEFAAYCGAAHCIGVASGLDALTLTLRAFGIGAGDEVIVPAHTFIATWLAVSATGAAPIGVDVDAATYNVDPARIKDAITPRTRAIIPVHLYGQPAAMEDVRAIADTHGLHVIEDAAQAHGARYRDRRAGALGHAAAFSFYPAKNLGCLGDGGAIVTSDAGIAKRVRLLRNYGSAVKYEHEIPGVNSRLDELQAAFLRVNLARLDEWTARRRRHAAHYLDAIRNADVTLPHVIADAEPVWHLFVVRSVARARIAAALDANGIATMIHYPKAPHRHEAYRDLAIPAATFPIAERVCDEVLSLPLDPFLEDDEIDHVADCLSSA